LESSLVAEGLKMLASLAEDPSNDVLLATDLHAGNVLRLDERLGNHAITGIAIGSLSFAQNLTR